MRELMHLYDILEEKMVTDPVEEAILRIRAGFQMSPWAINNGWCWGFAHKLAKALGPGAEILSTTKIEGMFPGHSIVQFNGRYYDAESPKGEDDPHQMKYNRRMQAAMDAEDRGEKPHWRNK
jgi:hypothetical protein